MTTNKNGQVQANVDTFSVTFNEALNPATVPGTATLTLSRSSSSNTQWGVSGLTDGMNTTGSGNYLNNSFGTKTVTFGGTLTLSNNNQTITFTVNPVRSFLSLVPLSSLSVEMRGGLPDLHVVDLHRAGEVGVQVAVVVPATGLDAGVAVVGRARAVPTHGQVEDDGVLVAEGREVAGGRSGVRAHEHAVDEPLDLVRGPVEPVGVPVVGAAGHERVRRVDVERAGRPLGRDVAVAGADLSLRPDGSSTR